MQWVIEDDVPMPPSRRGGYRPASDINRTMKQMRVGQSVCFGQTPINTVCGVMTTLKRGHALKFVTRISDEGVRVWRTE